MKILSHRGYWIDAHEKNADIAFHRSFDSGFGTETDVRDLGGKLVISHDMPVGYPLELSDFLEMLRGRNLPLAINIKADGLAQSLKKTMENYNVSDWFVFDMSIPDMRNYLNAGVPVFARMSEVERTPAWLEQSAGIWLDAFNSTWYSTQFIESLLEKGKRVCVVSPELHGRKHETLWFELLKLHSHESLMLCTDYPAEAKKYFQVADQ